MYLLGRIRDWINLCSSKSTIQNAYQTQELQKFILKKTLHYANNESLFFSPYFNRERFRDLNITKSIGCPIVVEIGGGAGIDYFGSRVLLKINPSLWINIETKTMVDLCNASIRDYPKLKFVTFEESVKFINRDFDFLYANSSLQYLDNQSRMLEDILILSPKYVTILRTPYIKNSKNLSLKFMQKSRFEDNGPHLSFIKSPKKMVQYEANIISLDSVTRILEKFGYRIEKMQEKEYWDKKSIDGKLFEIKVFDIFAKRV